jgi:integrase
LAEKGYSYDHELAKVPFMKVRTREKQTLSIEEIDHFLNLPPGEHSGPTYKMWTLFFSIVAYTGMRTGEVANLCVDDIDFGRNVFVIKDTKTRDTRFVPIPHFLIKELQNRISDIKTGLLFTCSDEGGHLRHQHWGESFHSRIRRMGIVRPNLTPYSLRHSYITEMLQTEGVNIFDVQRLVGHRNIATTENYYHLTTKRLQRASEKYPGIIKNDPEKIICQINDFLESLELSKDKRFVCKTSKDKNSFKFELKIQ